MAPILELRAVKAFYGQSEVVHGIDVAVVQASDLGADQRGAVREILRAVLSPDLELPVVRGQGLPVTGSLGSGGRVAK